MNISTPSYRFSAMPTKVGPTSTSSPPAKAKGNTPDPRKALQVTVKADQKEIDELFLKLETKISDFVIFQNNSDQQEKIRREAIVLIKEIKEHQHAFSHTKRSCAMAGIPIDLNNRDFFKNIQAKDLETRANVSKFIDKSKDYKEQVLKKLCSSYLKNHLSSLEDIFQNSANITGDLLELHDIIQKNFSGKNGILGDIETKIKILEGIHNYLGINSSLKNTADEISEAQKLSIFGRIKVYSSLQALKYSHPDLQNLINMVPDYNLRLKNFLKDLEAISNIDGCIDLVHQAAKNFLAKNEQGETLPFVLGAFSEARFNANLQANGYVLEAIGAKYVENLPFIIDEYGHDMLENIDLDNPDKAVKQLEKNGLLAKNSSSSRMRKLEFGSVNHILYFDTQTGEILSHKKNRTPDDNRIFVRQKNGSFALSEIDCICTKLENSNTYYVEHKITPESFIAKNLGTTTNLQEFESENPGQFSQLEKLMIIAKAHYAKPSIMIDFAKMKESGIKEHPLQESIQNLIKDVETKRPDLGKVTILDENAQDITEMFQLAA